MPIKNEHTDHFSSENKMLSSVTVEYMPNTESSPVKYLLRTCKAIHCRFVQYVKDINSVFEHKSYSYVFSSMKSSLFSYCFHQNRLINLQVHVMNSFQVKTLTMLSCPFPNIYLKKGIKIRFHLKGVLPPFAVLVNPQGKTEKSKLCYRVLS